MTMYLLNTTSRYGVTLNSIFTCETQLAIRTSFSSLIASSGGLSRKIQVAFTLDSSSPMIPVTLDMGYDVRLAVSEVSKSSADERV